MDDGRWIDSMSSSDEWIGLRYKWFSFSFFFLGGMDG